jgi:cytochrome c-type biogenesis protein CcmF
VTAVAVFALLGRSIGALPLLGLMIAPAVAVASVAPLWKRDLRRTPLFTWGMVIAHLGCAVSLVGMASDSAFTQETLAAVRPGETVRAGRWTLHFDKIMPLAGDSWTALQADISASRGGGEPVALHPQARTFTNPPTTTTESALLTRWDGQLYVVLGQDAGEGRWQLRVWWKPFVTLIWLGGVMIALGGALALLGRERRGWLRKWRARRDAA